MKLPKGMKVYNELGVVNGEVVFFLVDTIGLPLEMVILEIQKRKQFIDWPTFYLKAKNSRWSERRLQECRTLANNYYTEQWVEKTFGIKREDPN